MRQQGLTLIETIVAIAILAVLLAGFVNMVILGSRSLEAARMKYTAAKIAEEGLELIINKKENNKLCARDDSCPFIDYSPGDWEKNLLEVLDADGSYQVDASLAGAAGNDRQLPNHKYQNFNPNNFLCILDSGNREGQMGYCGNDPVQLIPGNYTREITTHKISDEKILVESIVRWKDRGLNKTLILDAVLYGIPII